MLHDGKHGPGVFFSFVNLLFVAAFFSADIVWAMTSAYAGQKKISFDMTPRREDTEDSIATQTAYGKPPLTQTTSLIVRNIVKDIALNGDVTVFNSLGGGPIDPKGPAPRVMVLDKHGDVKSVELTNGLSDDVFSRPIRLALVIASRPSRPKTPVGVGEGWRRVYADPAAPNSNIIVNATYVGEERLHGIDFYKITQTANVFYTSEGTTGKFVVKSSTWFFEGPDALRTCVFTNVFEARNLPTKSLRVAASFGHKAPVKGSIILDRFTRNGKLIFSNERSDGKLTFSSESDRPQ
jgi:hypothetical protein